MGLCRSVGARWGTGGWPKRLHPMTPLGAGSAPACRRSSEKQRGEEQFSIFFPPPPSGLPTRPSTSSRRNPSPSSSGTLAALPRRTLPAARRSGPAVASRKGSCWWCRRGWRWRWRRSPRKPVASPWFSCFLRTAAMGIAWDDCCLFVRIEGAPVEPLRGSLPVIYSLVGG